MKTDFSFLYWGSYIFPEHALDDALCTGRFPNYTRNTKLFLSYIFTSDKCIAGTFFKTQLSEKPTPLVGGTLTRRS